MRASRPARSWTAAVVIAVSALIVGTTTSAAVADLIRDTPFLIDIGGTGFGNVTSILTLHETGTETGAVTFLDPTGAGSPDVTAGAPHSLLRLAGDIGITSGSEIRLIFNGNETGGGLSVDITHLVLTIYNSDGTIQFTSGVFGAATGDIADVTQGSGQSGFVFKLDVPQAAAAGAIQSTDLIGLFATITNTDDGPDNFFIATSASPPPPVVPEPTTLLLLGAGLAGIGVYSRKTFRR